MVAYLWISTKIPQQLKKVGYIDRWKKNRTPYIKNDNIWFSVSAVNMWTKRLQMKGLDKNNEWTFHFSSPQKSIQVKDKNNYIIDNLSYLWLTNCHWTSIMFFLEDLPSSLIYSFLRGTKRLPMKKKNCTININNFRYF